VAAALIVALDAPAPTSRVYNVTGGEVRTATAIGEIISRLLPAADIACAPGPVPGDYRQARFDIGRAERELGWRPSWTLEAGIADYVRWLRDHDY
jgi:nucleoside-diphosphate-sugar epimerase